MNVFPVYDDPDDLAAAVAQLATPRLLAFDCDGVLAPLVDHADDSLLTLGVAEVLDRLATADATHLAIVSGRSVEGLEQFGFDPLVTVIGSHGAERRGQPLPPLDDAEAERLDRLDGVATRALQLAGPGAWVERKPTSVVLHVREADPQLGDWALIAAETSSASVEGSVAVPGSMVLELLARPTDKGTAVAGLRDELSAASVTYLGDDVTDEHAFAVLGDRDIGVKVGPGRSVASRRISDTDAVLTLLDALAGRLGV